MQVMSNGKVRRSKGEWREIISRYEQSDEELTLHVNPLQPAQIFSAGIRVIPTLGGSLQSGAAWIALGDTKIHIPPSRWTIN